MSCQVLLIGCNYPTSSYKLSGCINDGLLIKKMLIDNFNVKNENIIFMRDDIYSLNDPLFPSYDNIIKSLNKVIANSIANSIVEKSENIYIHFSGHGSFIKDTSGDETDKNDEFIVPADYFTNYKRITDDDLFNCLKQIPSNTKCFTVFDCCNSGTVLDLPISYTYQNNNFIEREENKNNSLNDKSTIISLSACRDDEYALDVIQNGKSNGAMTLAIFSVLTRNQYILDLKNCIIQIHDYLKSNKYTGQRPVLSCNKKIDLSENYYNFKGPNPNSTILVIDNVPVSIIMPPQSTSNTQSPTQPLIPPLTTPTQTKPPATTPTQARPPATTTNNNLVSIESVLDMILKNKLCTKQELNNIIEKITA